MRIDWIGQLTGMTSNEKCNQFSDIVNVTMNDIAPIRTVRISSKRRYVEPWMTKGLETVSKTKLRLHKEHLKKSSTEDDLKNDKEYHNQQHNWQSQTQRQHHTVHYYRWHQENKT